MNLEKRCLDRLFITEEFNEGTQSKKELHINEECMAKSRLDIWSRKNSAIPKDIQYEIYKGFILKFEIAFSAFVNLKADLFHYTLKGISYCGNIDEVECDRLEEIYERNEKSGKYISLKV